MREELKRIIWMKKGIRNNSSLIFTEIFIDSVKEVKWLNREHMRNCWNKTEGIKNYGFLRLHFMKTAAII